MWVLTVTIYEALTQTWITPDTIVTVTLNSVKI